MMFLNKVITMCVSRQRNTQYTVCVATLDNTRSLYAVLHLFYRSPRSATVYGLAAEKQDRSHFVPPAIVSLLISL